MWQFILIGDILVMGFMVAIIMWISLADNKKAQQEHMKIPLGDD